jgi:DNA-directed RNA polymerase subunit M/transcription elongation factor TFIIS
MTATTTAPSDKPAKREAPRYVYTQRPRCPECGSVRLLTYATKKNGDSSLTRYAKCAECGAKVVLVVE